jgi:hypothetical protein
MSAEDIDRYGCVIDAFTTLMSADMELETLKICRRMDAVTDTEYATSVGHLMHSKLAARNLLVCYLEECLSVESHISQ